MKELIERLCPRLHRSRVSETSDEDPRDSDETEYIKAPTDSNPTRGNDASHSTGKNEVEKNIRKSINNLEKKLDAQPPSESAIEDGKLYGQAVWTTLDGVKIKAYVEAQKVLESDGDADD